MPYSGVDRDLREAERAWRQEGRLEDAARYAAALRRSRFAAPRRWPMVPGDAERSFMVGDDVLGALAVLTCHVPQGAVAHRLPVGPGVLFVGGWLLTLDEADRLALGVQAVLDVPAIRAEVREQTLTSVRARLGRSPQGPGAFECLSRHVADGRLCHPVYRAALRLVAGEPEVAAELEAIALVLIEREDLREEDALAHAVGALLRDVPALVQVPAIRDAFDRAVARGGTALCASLWQPFAAVQDPPAWTKPLRRIAEQVTRRVHSNYFPDV